MIIGISILRLIIYDFPEQGVQIASICDHNSKLNIRNSISFVIGILGHTTPLFGLKGKLHFV